MFESFGMGYMLLNPLTTVGNPAPNPTPLGVLGLQSGSFEIDQKFVELKGANKGPDDVATADMTVKGKVEMARIDVDLFNQIYFAETPATNAPIIVPDEAHTVPAMTAFTVTIGTTTIKDLGVRYTNGQPFQKVTSLTAAGQYTVAISAGTATYTFFSADASANVLISYEKSSTTGTLLTVHNQRMGYGPIVEAFMWENYNSVLNLSANNGFHFYAVRFGKLGHTLKRDNFIMTSFDFEAFPNPNANTGAGNPWFDYIDGGGTGE